MLCLFLKCGVKKTIFTLFYTLLFNSESQKRKSFSVECAFYKMFSVLRKKGVFLKRNLSRLCSRIASLKFDIDYYCNAKNTEEIKHNIGIRKGVGDIDRVLELYESYKVVSTSDSSWPIIRESLYKELSILPNRTHRNVMKIVEPTLKREINKKRNFGEYSPLEFSDIAMRLNLVRTEKLGNTCGHKSYYFLGEMAELEEALIKYTVSELLKKKFKLISVPDILPRNVLESCGMTIDSDRTQIYSLDAHHHGPDLYLSGTAEMSLAGLLMDSVYEKHEFPLKLAAVSRCYRAETSNIVEERGIYRVHQFTKVEMFVVTTPDQSDEMLEIVLQTQEDLFSPLGLHMQVLDMPPHELGAPAYRKYDIEAWMPGRKTYGEISSCSNCTDYQSRRLNIKYIDNGKMGYVHTLNGTACAVPRMLIALLETHQHPKGKIMIPEVLQPFMKGKKHMTKNLSVPELKLLKIKK